MPTRERFIGPASYLGGGGYGGGSSIADLILANGRAAAEAEMRTGDIWRDTIGNAAGALSTGLIDYGKKRDEARVQGAVRSAMAAPARKTPGMDVNGNPIPETTGAPDIRSILNSLPPELQGRAMKGIQDWQEFSTKRAESDARLQKLTQEIEETKRKHVQDDADKLAMGAHHVESLFDSPQGAVAGVNMLYSAAKADKLTDDRFDDFVSGINDAWSAAKGNPQNEAIFLDALKQQALPILQGLKQGASASVQEKFTEKGVALGEGSVLVNPVTGKKIAEGEPRRETRSLEVQRAEALAQGDAPKAASLLAQLREEAAAKRDPNVAAARMDAAAERRAARGDARADRSYQFNSAELERTAKPLTDQAERFSRLVDTVGQRTPQADALIAPELLTVMAGGSGSGLRMNEAEISRIIGGRTAYEGLKAALNKYSLDPSKGLSITDAQRQQIQALIGDMNTRIQNKAAALNEARQALINADTVEDQRKVMADLKAKLTATGTPDGGGPKKITSKADYDALPKGAQYIDPTGQPRTKQ